MLCKHKISKMYKTSLRNRNYTSEMRSPYLQFNKKPSEPESPPWSKLPPTAVVVIFQCLKDVDRINMCKVKKINKYMCLQLYTLLRKTIVKCLGYSN